MPVRVPLFRRAFSLLCTVLAALSVGLLTSPEANAQVEIELPVPDGSLGFGSSVAIRGDYAAVGAPQTSSSRGAVYMYRFDGSAWVPDGTLIAPDGATGDLFGTAVSIGPDPSVAIGAPAAGTGTEGSVYVFERTVEGAWVLRQTLRATGGLGARVVLRDTYLAASGTSTTGGLRVWLYNGSTWIGQCTRSNVLPTSLAISSPYLVYTVNTLGTVLDMDTCSNASSFTVGTAPQVSADLDRIAYLSNYDLRLRPDITGSTDVRVLTDDYGDLQFLSLRRQHLAAASRLNDATPELFVLQQRENEEWGVFRRGYPTTARPSALAVTGRFMIVGAPNGTAGRAFLFDLFELPFFYPPILLSPAAGATDQGTPLSFEWSPVEGAQSYVLEVDDTATFGSPAIRETGLPDTTFLATVGLAEDRLYYWRVRGDRADDPGPWSAVREFRTAVVNTPAPPALSFPGNNATNVPLTVDLRWTTAPLADEYQVQVARSSDFTDLILDTSVAALQVQVSDLQRGRRYWWRVRSGNEIGFGAWSLIRSFVTVPRAPVVPSLVLPADGAVDVPRNPFLVWSPPSQLATYRVHISRTPDFAVLDVDAPNVTDTTYQVPGSLQATRLHYWRVRAANGTGTSDWSPTATFITGELVGTEHEEPDAFAFSEPIPNPSAGRVSFALRLPAVADVRLVVYDVLGREVAVLVDGDTAAGTHVVGLDASALPAGVYVARLTTGRFVQTRRLTIAR